MNQLSELSCAAFADALAAKTSVPGGGGASALVGALGVARTLLYKGTVTEPLYTLQPDGTVCDGTDTDAPSFFREYKFKLEKLYDRFYTDTGAQLARARKAIAAQFYESLYREVSENRLTGQQTLSKLLAEAE